MPHKANTRKRGQEQSPEERDALIAFRKLTKSLSSSKGDDITLSCEADLGSRYSRLLQEVKLFKGPFDIRVGNNIHTAVFKAVPKTPKNIHGRIFVSRESLRLATEVLSEIVRRCAQRSKDVGGLEALIKRCASTLIDFAKGRKDGFGWAQVAFFYQTAASSADLPLEALVSENSLGPTLTILKEGLVNGLINLLQAGEVIVARQILAVCSSHWELDEACRSVLQKVLSQRASTFPRDSLLAAMRHLGMGAESEKLDYANPAESPEMRQAAALLLYLFDMHRQSPELEEAFDRYRAIAESQFYLFLRGDVESTMSFDPRVHESPELGDPGYLVTVIRPWVEWYKPPDARVVIRGIVEPKLDTRGDRE